ncbi:MAG TPA: hypothetical protein VGX92_20560 [Pyrinomonadaceae bacterium]|jgi:hypothetical protein|nr:hypothetical protein [Pyrinomonadaceae bacterium]
MEKVQPARPASHFFSAPLAGDELTKGLYLFIEATGAPLAAQGHPSSGTVIALTDGG